MRRALYILPCPIYGKCCTALRTDRVAGAAPSACAAACMSIGRVWKTKGSTLPDSPPIRPPPASLHVTSPPTRRPVRRTEPLRRFARCVGDPPCGPPAHDASLTECRAGSQRMLGGPPYGLYSPTAPHNTTTTTPRLVAGFRTQT